MAKWFGKVGYVTTEEKIPGVYTQVPEERRYYGEILTNTSKWSASNKINDDLTVSNRISIIADPFAYQKFRYIKYVEFMDTFWEVTNAEVQYPRIILSLGGAYNGELVRPTE